VIGVAVDSDFSLRPETLNPGILHQCVRVIRPFKGQPKAWSGPGFFIPSDTPDMLGNQGLLHRYRFEINEDMQSIQFNN
jgi:hypothetical protein